MMKIKFAIVYTLLGIWCLGVVWVVIHSQIKTVAKTNPPPCLKNSKAVADCIKTQLHAGGVDASVVCKRLNTKRFICDGSTPGGCGLMDVRITRDNQVIVRTGSEESC